MKPSKWRARLAICGVALAVAVLAGVAGGTVPNPDFDLAVDVVQEGLTLTYTIHFDNVGAASSAKVVVTDTFPAEATYLGDPADLIDGVWTRTYTNVTVGAHEAAVSVRLADTVPDGARVHNIVVLRYVDTMGTWTERSFATEFAVALGVPAAPAAPIPVWVAAATPAAALVAGVVLVRRPRRAKLEQVFLMHNSGMLIHHWAANVSPTRDLDILSGMFMIMKEFVRDSFREKKGGLTELQFGDSRIFLAEGRHAVLAAVASGRRVNGLPGEIASAVADFERIHGGALTGWVGRLDELPGAKSVVDGLVHGRYRNWRMT